MENLKTINIYDILEKVDEGLIDIDNSFLVTGVISSIAPINEPNTYIKKSVNLKESLYSETPIIEIKQYPLPISKFIVKNEKAIAFLYGDKTDNNAFTFDTDNKGIELIVRDYNKFIPILIDKNLLFDNINKKVKLKVKVKIINNKEINGILKYTNPLYEELFNLFYDPYNVNIHGIILEVEKVEDVINEKVNLGEFSFGIEYKIKEEKENNFIDFLKHNIEQYSLSTFINTMNINKVDKYLLNLGDNVIGNINDNNIGFYIKIDINNRNNYKNKIKVLQITSKKFLNGFNATNNIEISFISDEEKRSIFEY